VGTEQAYSKLAYCGYVIFTTVFARCLYFMNSFSSDIRSI